MSILVELETLPEVVEGRQQYLRSLVHPVAGVERATFRQRTGHALVRLGRWIEGCRPDDAATILATPRAASPRLAGGAR